MKDFGTYVIITDPVLSPQRIAEVCVSEGIAMLQVRLKHAPDRELLALCRSLREITRGTSTKLIVNDRPDIALLSDADGVHLGQGDVTLGDARRIVGEKAIVGLSTHSIAQARKALAEHPDYIGFGPVYPTPTKAVADPTVGTELLREVLGFADVPVVAIGGIDMDNLNEVLEAGARNVCAVRWFMQTENFAERLRQFSEALSVKGRR